MENQVTCKLLIPPNIPFTEKQVKNISLDILFQSTDPKNSLIFIPGGKVNYEQTIFEIQPSIFKVTTPTKIYLSIYNTEYSVTETPPNFYISMYLINLDESEDLRIEWAKIEKYRLKILPEYDNQYLLSPYQATKFDKARKIKIFLKYCERITNDPPYSQNQLDLFEIAKNSGISATAFMLSTSHLGSNRIRLFAFDNNTIRDGIDKKTYFPIFIYNHRIVVCADSGSDLTIIQLSLFNKNFLKKNIPLQNTDLTVTSYSSNDLQVVGQVAVFTKFELKGPYVLLNLTVVRDINADVPSFLFGNDSMRKTLATLTYTGEVDNPAPEVIIKRPYERKLNTYFESPRNLLNCSAE